MAWFLSDEQMGAVWAGEGEVIRWQPVALLEGAAVPPWALDLHVDFADAYGNDPRYKIKATEDLRTWDKRFVKSGPRYMAEHTDGRAEIYYHDGALRPEKVRRFRTLDGKLHAYRPATGVRVTEQLEGGGTINHVPPDPGEWVEVERLCSTIQGGFGGSHFDLTLDDGTEVTLRGPWHGGSPPDFMDVSYVNWSMDRRYWRSGRGPGRQWANRGGIGGLYIRHATFIALFSRFAPHLDLLAVEHGGRTRLQAAKPEWSGKPKAVIQQEEQQAAKVAALALLEAAGATGIKAETGAPIWAFNEWVQEGRARRDGPWNAPTYYAVEEA